MNQRIAFTVNDMTISRNAAQTELGVEDSRLFIIPDTPGFCQWVIVYESSKEARLAFNIITSGLADGEPVVHVPGPGFMQAMKEEVQ